MLAHQLRPSGAVEAEIEEIGVEQRYRQRLGVLAGQHRAGGLDGDRHRHWQTPPGLIERREDADGARFDVAAVLTGLEQQVIGSARHQT
jgi:hypothetical protein